MKMLIWYSGTKKNGDINTCGFIATRQWCDVPRVGDTLFLDIAPEGPTSEKHRMLIVKEVNWSDGKVLPEHPRTLDIPSGIRGLYEEHTPHEPKVIIYVEPRP